MKKHIMILLFTLILAAGPLMACHIEFDPPEVTVKKGEIFRVTVVLELEHRRCELTLDDTQYEVEGLEIVKKGDWKSEDRFTHRQEITLKLTADKGTLEVLRECTRKGLSEGVLTVKAAE